jgi:hypothetical protein
LAPIEFSLSLAPITAMLLGLKMRFRCFIPKLRPPTKTATFPNKHMSKELF